MNRRDVVFVDLLPEYPVVVRRDGTRTMVLREEGLRCAAELLRCPS